MNNNDRELNERHLRIRRSIADALSDLSAQQITKYAGAYTLDQALLDEADAIDGPTGESKIAHLDATMTALEEAVKDIG